MIDAVIEGLIGGYLGDRLLKLIPPKKKSAFDALSWDELRRRNGWIETAGLVVFGCTFLGFFVLFLAFGTNDAWQAGAVMGLPFFVLFLFIGLVTLKSGWTRFREYWRYHELKHRIRLAVLLSLYIPSTALGLVCMFKLLPYR